MEELFMKINEFLDVVNANKIVQQSKQKCFV